MKTKLFSFLLLTVLFTGIKAQDFGKVIIRNASAAYPKFIASMNGIRLSNDYNNSVTFNYLDENGNYRVKILQSGSTVVLNFMVNSSPNYVSKYIINKDNLGNYALILESKSLLSIEDTEVPVTHTVVVTPTVAPVINTVVVVPAATITNMPDEDFKSRLASVLKESFDKDRMARCKDVFADEYFSTGQVTEVMKKFSFDDSKVNFAKWAYSRTMDKKNYYKVVDQLTFASDKKELSEYIKKQPKE